MKHIISFLLLLTVSCLSFGQDTASKNLPVTTDSEQALVLFNEGMEALDEVLLVNATEKFTRASELDPDFIMPRVMIALRALFSNDTVQFQQQAGKVLKSRAHLTSSEELIQQAMKTLADNPGADASNYGQKLVKEYPESVLAHQLLASFQSLAKDYQGALKTYEETLKITRKPAPIYNAMGYTYMALDQMDKAKEAFDKYLQVAPNTANAYDSMGDYYARAKDYANARQNYLKAYQMDSTNFLISSEKAGKIKEQLAEE